MKKFTIISAFLIAGSINVNAQWSQLNCPHPGRTNCIVASGTNLFAGIENGGVYLSTNDGTSWTPVNTGLTNTGVRAISISSANIFAGTAGSGIFLSTNNGTSWTPMNSGLTNSNVTSVIAMSPYISIGTNGGGVFGSSNNGATWATNNVGLTNLNVKTLALVGYSLFAGTSTGVFIYNSATTSWSVVNTGLTNLDVYKLTGNGTDIYAATQGGGIFKSTNLGTSWSAINTGLTFNYVTDIALSGATMYSGTNGGGVFVSANSGGNWLNINSNGLIRPDVYSIGVNSNYVFAGTDTSGVWRRALSDATGLKNENVNNNLVIYPNPSSDKITVALAERNGQPFYLNITNVLGTKVLSQKAFANEGAEIINVSQLDEGIYFLRIVSDNQILYDKKIIIAR